MGSLLRKYWFFTLISVLFFASASLAQTSRMDLTGVNGTSLDGVYTNPYEVSINYGAPVAAICDDYADDTYVGDIWQATATNLASVGASNSAVKWNFKGSNDTNNFNTVTGTQLLYDEVAYLATKLLAASPGQAQADYSYAIWELTCTASANPGANANCSPTNAPFNALGSGSQDYLNASGYLALAEAQNYNNANYSNFTIYTPTCTSSTGAPTTCSGDQEYIVAPESSSGVLLSADLLGLLGLVFLFRRRLFRPVQ